MCNHSRCCSAFFLAVITVCLTPFSSQAQSVGFELGPAEAVPETLYTFNSNLLTATAFHGITYDGPEFENAVRNVRPFGLRFPGGTIANNYLWREDSFSEQKDDKTKWAGEQLRLFRQIGRPYGLPGFAELCKKHDLQPIWVLNVYEETPDSAVGLMKHLAQLGLRVQAVELANEPYWDPRSLINVWNYSRFSQPIALAIKEHDPTIKIGACFGPLNQQTTNYEEKWNAVLAKQTWYDAVVYHEYYGGQGFSMEQGMKLPLEALLHPEGLIDLPVEELARAVPGKPIWFTEWNIGSKGLEQWRNKGAEILFLGAAFVRLFEHRDRIHWACFHQIYGGNFGTTSYDKDSGTMQTTVSWQFFRMLGTTLSNATTFRTATFATDDLRGFAAGHSDGLCLFVVNRGKAARTIDLPDGFEGDLGHWTMDCPPDQLLPTSKPLLKESKLDVPTVSLAPYSVNLIGANLQFPADLSTPETADNLFPRRPHLTLWYPPYARQQPRFDIHGVYTLNFGPLRDKPTAVVKINLSALELRAGGNYLLQFEAKSDGNAGFVTKLPVSEPDGGDEEKGGRFTILGSEYRRLQFSFECDAEAGEITFVFPETTIANGPTISFRNFSIGAMGDP